MHRLWTVTSSGEESHLICLLMFAFPEQLPADRDEIRDLTREFSNLLTAINIKIFKKRLGKRTFGGLRGWQEGLSRFTTLGFKDEYYLELFLCPSI